MKTKKHKKLMAIIVTMCLTVGTIGTMAFAQEPEDEDPEVQVEEELEEEESFEEEGLPLDDELEPSEDENDAEEESEDEPVSDHEHHSEIYVEAVEATCTDDGNIGFWICDDCGQFINANYNGAVLTEEEVKIEALGHQNLHHFSAIDPSCEEEGNLEYWFCEDCEMFFLDEELTEEAEADEVMIPALGHSMFFVEAQDPTCEEDGIAEHFECELCGRMFADEELEEELFEEDIVLVALGHNLVYVEEVEATEDEEGSIGYYLCEECGRMFEDEDASFELTAEDLVLSALLSDDSDEEDDELNEDDELELEQNDAEENEEDEEASEDEEYEEDEAEYIEQYEYLDEYEYYDEYINSNAESGTTYRESGDETLGISETVSNFAIVLILCAAAAASGMVLVFRARKRTNL